MTVAEVLHACARRWYVLLLLLIVTVVLGLREYRAAEPVYTVTSSVVILPSPSLVQARLPTSSTGGITINPFTSVSTGTTLGVVVADALNRTSVQDRLLAGGTGLAEATWSYQQSQLVSLSTTSADPDEAGRLMDLLVAAANTTAHEIQAGAGAPADQLFDAVAGAPGDYPEASYPERLRTVVGIGLAGLAVAVLVVVLVDRLVVAVARRRQLLAPRSAMDPSGGDAGAA